MTCRQGKAGPTTARDRVRAGPLAPKDWSVLIIDLDERPHSGLSQKLRGLGVDNQYARNHSAVVARRGETTARLIVLVLGGEAREGLQCLQMLLDGRSDASAIVFAREASLDLALAAGRIGATAFRVTPASDGHLAETVRELVSPLSEVPIVEALEADRHLADPRVRCVLARIASAYASPLDIGALANQVNLSPSRLRRLFRKCAGISVTKALRHRRLEAAAVYLRSTSLRISEVCYKVGFESPNHFANIFRVRFGVSPSAYRNRVAPLYEDVRFGK